MRNPKTGQRLKADLDSLMQLLLIHYITQAAEQRATRSWALSSGKAASPQCSGPCGYTSQRLGKSRVLLVEVGGVMITAINDDLFTLEVTADPYPYFDRLREEDPVHWNEKYGVWIITRYDDVVWLLRHPEWFSSEVFKRDPREPYPPIQAS